MGTLIFGFDKQRLTIEDRAMAHIEVVIVQKFRRSEGACSASPDQSTRAAAA